jgi:hypothetical protein
VDSHPLSYRLVNERVLENEPWDTADAWHSGDSSNSVARIRCLQIEVRDAGTHFTIRETAPQAIGPTLLTCPKTHFPCSKAKQSQWSCRRRTKGAAMFENSFSIAAPPEWLVVTPMAGEQLARVCPHARSGYSPDLCLRQILLWASQARRFAGALYMALDGAC